MTFYSFFMYVVISCFTPGPNNIMSMSSAGRVGFKKTMPLTFGVGVGCFLVAMLCIAFSVVLYQLIPTVKPIMTAIGAFYILFLAYKTYKSTSLTKVKKKEDNKSNEETETQKEENTGWTISFPTAVLLQFINPKCILYCLTVASSYIVLNHNSIGEYAVLSCMMGAIAITSTWTWAGFGSVFKKVLERHMYLFNTTMSILLVYCAVSLYL